LTSSAASGNQWYKNTVLITAATGTTYTANASGSYTVVATTSGCSSTSLATVVTVNTLPPKPTITAAGNILSSSSATNNQWFLDGNILAGAISQQYTALASGMYTVQVTQNGCSTLSDAFNFVATGIVDPSSWNNEVIIFPNPVYDQLFISNTGSRKLIARLIDATGRTVLEITPNALTGIPTRKLVPGIYLLLITDVRKGETIVRTVLKK
jgi:hypothetical protein